MGANVLVTDDADGLKTIADEVGVQHQVCKAHVVRNTEDLIERYQRLVAHDADGSEKVWALLQAAHLEQALFT